MNKFDEMLIAGQKVLQDILETLCKDLKNFFEVAVIEKNSGKTYSYSGKSIYNLKCWQQPLLNYKSDDLILVIYINNEEELFRKMGNSFYDNDKNEFPMLETVLLRILGELSKIICDDLEYNKYTINYPGDKEMILEKAVIDFFAEQGLPSPTYITCLSSLTYESSECSGKIKFLSFDNYENLDSKKILEFADDIYLSDLRIIRKLLEISKEKINLIVDYDWQRVIGLEYENENNTSKGFYSIKIIKNMNWVLYFDDMKVVEFKNGGYSIYEYTDMEERIKDKLKELYKNDDQSFDQAYKLINYLREQKHGTLAVITPLAEKEANRLCKLKRGIKIERFLTLDHFNVIKSITAIDGAILLDNQFNCYAIGVILDGIASAGLQSRGARFNSALTYVNWQKDKTEKVWAVVVSEDGMVDIVV